MALNVVGLIIIILFYLLILVVGVVAAWKIRVKGQQEGRTLEASLVAGRDLPTAVGVFTMIATTVGGGYINGTAESVASYGLVWTVAPLGIFCGLSLGGIIFARVMRDRKYVTMLDPFQDQYGHLQVLLVYLATLCGDLFWTASILSALGTSLSVIIDLPLTATICVSSAVTVSYTMIGQLIAVAYTDIAQLALITFGLVLSVPFVLTNENVGDITANSSQWMGSLDRTSSLTWVDLFIAMTFGTIPWQAYFQRVLAVRSGTQARVLSIIGGCGALVLVIPSILIGAASVSADWNVTSLKVSPLEIGESRMVLPLVLKEFTPTPVALLGLGAISAAVMSSMDSSILGSSSMFTHNIYNNIIRPQAKNWELLVVQRVAVVTVGVLATVISLHVRIIYGLFILAADIVFVIVLPQLSCALFLPRTNAYGALIGYGVGLLLRLGAGDRDLHLVPFIPYPYYTPAHGQLFPFRTFAMICSALTIFIISELFRSLFSLGIIPRKLDVLKAFSPSTVTLPSQSTTEQSIALVGHSAEPVFGPQAEQSNCVRRAEVRDL
ncbi:high affinity choline transporter 1-like isoform X1 [Haliotis rufescens]|uniref:high affinity choline transporter 1-like isoform X1 n=2 Tax=Haliotis rufescens TaxID=6454 RepID=UPI00201EAE1A|nr:high affinity choline transporter 1-like isoform X1 [Haliotis rufescens]